MVVNKPKSAFRTISEVAEDLGVATHVLRFWESKFSQIKPMKRNGGRRYYRPDDVELLSKIKYYLYDERYTIEGVQRLIKEKGIKSLVGEEIQKDLIDMIEEKTELDDNSRKVLSFISSELRSVKNKLENLLKNS